MANTDFFLESLTEITTPEVTVESVVFSFKTALDANLASDNDPFEKPQKFINARIKLKTFDTYNPITGRGFWKNSEILSKYLKYKAIATISLEETRTIIKNIYQINNIGGNKIKTITLDDFKLEKIEKSTPIEKTPFYTYYEVNIQKEKIADIDFLYLILIPYFDQNEICKDFNITLENVIDIEKFFFGKPNVTSIISSRQYNPDIKIINLTSIESLKQDLYLSLKQKKVAIYENYFSDLFATYDFLDFIVADETHRKGRLLIQSNKKVVRFGFFFDKLRFVKENSIFPQLFVSANIGNYQFIRESVEMAIKTLNISVTRKRKNKLTQTSGFEEEIIADGIAANSINDAKGYLYGPSKIAGVDRVDFYSGIDIDISNKTGGEYIYAVKATVYDPTYKIINNLRGQFLQHIRTVNIYKSIIDQPIIQYEEAKDINPYIDINDANQKYSFKNYGYNVTENRYVLESEDANAAKKALETVIEDFINFNRYFALNLNMTSAEYQQLKETLFFICLPPTGNPEGTQTLLELLQECVNSLNFLLAASSPSASTEISGYIPPDEPNSFKQLSIEKEFTNFTADAEIVQNFGLNYHNANKTTNSGLLFIPVVENEFSDTFDVGTSTKNVSILELFKSLKEVYLPTKNLFLTIPVHKGVSQNNPADPELAFNIDTILTLSKNKNIETIISTVDAGLLVNDMKSPEQARSAFKNLVFNNFDILLENKIIPNKNYFTGYIKPTDISTSLLNTLQELMNKSSLNLYNEVIFKILSWELLNFSQTTYDESTLIKQYKNISNRQISFLNFNAPFINSETGGLLISSAFKLFNNTYKKASFVSFNLIDETNKNTFGSDIIYDSYYNLKDAKYINASLVGASIKNDEILLGYLSDYIDPANYLYEQPYENVPIINKYFLFNRSLINGSLTEEQININETTQAVSAMSAPGTITGVVTTAEVLTPEERTLVAGVPATTQVQTSQTELQQTAETARASTTGKKIDFSQALNSALANKT